MIKPLGQRVLVDVLPKEEATKGGIILFVDSQKEKNIGIIVELADGIELNIGDKIIFGQYSGDDIEEDGKKYKIVNYEDILALCL